MIIRNPSGRPIRLELQTGADEVAMALTVGAGASVDLARYQRALDALTWAERDSEGPADDTGTPE